MKLYIELSDEQYEQVKAFMEKPNLEDHTPEELASALFKAIEREGGTIKSETGMSALSLRNQDTKLGKIRCNDIIITLKVENS